MTPLDTNRFSALSVQVQYSSQLAASDTYLTSTHYPRTIIPSRECSRNGGTRLDHETPHGPHQASKVLYPSPSLLIGPRRPWACT